MVTFKTGPIVTTVGLEIELPVTPQVALALAGSVGRSLVEEEERFEAVVGGLRRFFRPEGNRWSITLYCGGWGSVLRPELAPLGGVAVGYEWNLGARWRVSVEAGMAVAIDVVAGSVYVIPYFEVFPVPRPILGVGVGYRF